MTENDSYFYENGGSYGGIYWCDACTIYADNNFYQDHVALDGSMGYFKNGFDVTFDHSSIGLAKAFYDNFTSKNNGRGERLLCDCRLDWCSARRPDFQELRLCAGNVVFELRRRGLHDHAHRVPRPRRADLLGPRQLLPHLRRVCVEQLLTPAAKAASSTAEVLNFQKLGTVALCATTNITADGGSAFFSS